MTPYAAAAVLLTLGLAVSGCDQSGGARGGPFGGMGAASSEQFNNPDTAPVGGRDPVESPAATSEGGASIGNYDGGGSN
jgi:hypothetical protein